MHDPYAAPARPDMRALDDQQMAILQKLLVRQRNKEQGEAQFASLSGTLPDLARLKTIR